MKMLSTKSSIKPRVVVDTNVFVSALIWGGNPQRVIQTWLKSHLTLLLSPFLMTEILFVLERFGFEHQDLRNLQRILENNSVKIFPPKKVTVCRDKKDNQILDLCLSGKAIFLITGDKDLLDLKDFHETKIIKPKEFLEIFYKKEIKSAF